MYVGMGLAPSYAAHEHRFDRTYELHALQGRGFSRAANSARKWALDPQGAPTNRNEEDNV
jgi:hypothetical protein